MTRWGAVFGLAAMSTAALVACGGPSEEQRPRSLLARFVVSSEAPSTEVSGPVDSSPHRVLVGGSWREAVQTIEGSPRIARLDGSESPSDGRLELAVAALRPERSGGVVELRVELASRTLLHDRLAPADGWVRHSLALPAKSRGELILSSSGPSPVAWSELYLCPEAEGETAAARSAADERPSIILISLDTVRADHLSLYGYPRPTSPNLDRFAVDSWVFADSWSTSTWTLPSHGTMFTGLLPDRHGLRQVDDTLAEEVVTIAERLRQAGYRTAAITDGGFLDPHWGFAQGFERYDVTAGPAWAPKDAAAIFGSAARWVEENRRRPFFLFVHSYEAHQPYVNRDGFADPFLDPRYDGPFTQRVNVLSEVAKIRPVDRAQVRALYDGGIRRLDHHLGIFLRQLERRGVLDEAAVIVTSDHGEELGEHGGWEHVAGKLFPENVRVPLILRPPGGLGRALEGAEGRTAADGGAGVDRFPTTPVSTLDLYPTLVELARLDGAGLAGGGEEPPLVRAGRSLLAIAAAPPEPERTLLLHGLNSVPEPVEVRYRLDRGSRSLLFDRRRGSASRFDRRLDPGMERPLPALDGDGRGAGLMARLQMTLAWLEPDGLAVRPPAGSRRVGWPPGSGFRFLGGWNGLDWMSPAAELELAPERPAVLLLAPIEGGGGRELLATSAEGEKSRLRLEPMAAGASESYHPLVAGPPPPGTLVPTARRHRAEIAEPQGERREELEALGYL